MANNALPVSYDWGVDKDARDLEYLLTQLNVPNTKIVKEAEARIGMAMKDKACVPVLLRVLRFSRNVVARQLSAVLLRIRIAHFWKNLDLETRKFGKKLVLEALSSETERLVSLSTTYVVSALSREEMEEGASGWDELLQFLQVFAHSSNAQQQELAMRLFYALTETIGTAFQPHFNELKELYSRMLQQSTDTRVRIAALKACGALIDYLSSGEDVLVFRELVPLLLDGVRSNLDDDVLVVQIVEIVGQLAESPAPILNKYLRQAVHVLILVLKSERAEDLTKEAVVDALCKIMVCKSRFIIKLGLTPELLDVGIFCLIGDYPTYCQVLMEQELTQKEIEVHKLEGEDLSCRNLGQPVIATLTLNMPSRNVLKPVLAATTKCLDEKQQGMFNNVPAEWVWLSILLHSTEGLVTDIGNGLDELLPRVVNLAKQNREPVIRATALMLLSEWVQFLTADIWDKMPLILPSAIEILRQDKSIVVRTSACELIELIADDIEEEALLPHVNSLVQNLLFLAAKGENIHIQATSLCALSSVMVTTGHRFMPFFDETCRVICPLATITDENKLQVRGEATSALGNLALACSRAISLENSENNLHRFKPLLAEVLNFAINGLAFEDLELKRLTYGMLSNVADAFGEEISPVVGPFLKVLIPALEADDDGEIDVEDRDGAVVSESFKKRFIVDGNDGDADNSEQDFQYQPGVKITKTIRMETVEAKQAALQATERLVVNAPGSALLVHFEKILEASVNCLDHGHMSVVVAAIATTCETVLALARCHPFCELNRQELDISRKFAMCCFSEIDPDRRWVPGAPVKMETPLQRILEICLPHWHAVFTSSPHKVVVCTIFASIERLLAHLGCAVLVHLDPLKSKEEQEDTFQYVMQMCLDVINEKAMCQRLDILDQLEEEDSDNSDDEDDNDHEKTDLFDCACNLLGMISKAFGRKFMPFAGPVFECLLRRKRVSQRRRVSILGVFVEVIQGLGPDGAVPFVDNLFPIAISCLLDEDSMTRRNAAYLLGNVICLGGSNIQCNQQMVFQALQSLEPLLAEAALCEQMRLQHEQDSSSVALVDLEDLQACVDNACGAVARIMISCPTVVPVEQILPALLDCLPLRFDFSENYSIVHWLARLCDSQNQTALARSSDIVQLFITIVMEQEEVGESLLKQDIQRVFTSIAKAQSALQVTPQQRQVIQQLLQD